MTNRLLIAAAGAGKTTYLIKEALKKEGNVLITTYTEANEEEIKAKIITLNKFIPGNITVQTWFSFLIQHGVRPYQGGLTKSKIEGLAFVQQQSAKYQSEEKQFEAHYFSSSRKIYSDKLAKFVVRSNEKSNGNVVDRIARIYPYIFIDEVQDLAGYDLEVLTLLFKSIAEVTLVGDPRQVTYLTHPDKLHSKYKDGRIEDFILDKCKTLNCEIDKATLRYSHRNNKELCDFSSQLYPNFPASLACTCKECRTPIHDHTGIFLVPLCKLQDYIEVYQPIILRYKEAGENEWNFGKSKGLSFERVLIFPTKNFVGFLKDGKLKKTVKGKTTNTFDIPKLYVALTRARHSVGIVYDYKDNEIFIQGVKKF